MLDGQPLFNGKYRKLNIAKTVANYFRDYLGSKSKRKQKLQRIGKISNKLIDKQNKNELQKLQMWAQDKPGTNTNSIFELEMQAAIKLPRQQLISKIRELEAMDGAYLAWSGITDNPFPDMNSLETLQREDLQQIFATYKTGLRKKPSNSVDLANIQYSQRLKGRQKGRAYRSFP